MGGEGEHKAAVWMFWEKNNKMKLKIKKLVPANGYGDLFLSTPLRVSQLQSFFFFFLQKVPLPLLSLNNLLNSAKVFSTHVTPLEWARK